MMDTDRPSKLIEVWYEEVHFTKELLESLDDSDVISTFDFKRNQSLLRLTAYFDLINEWGLIVSSLFMREAASYYMALPQELRLKLEIINDGDYRATINRAQEIWNSEQSNLIYLAVKLLTEHKSKYA